MCLIVAVARKSETFTASERDCASRDDRPDSTQLEIKIFPSSGNFMSTDGCCYRLSARPITVFVDTVIELVDAQADDINKICQQQTILRHSAAAGRNKRNYLPVTYRLSLNRCGGERGTKRRNTKSSLHRSI